MALSIRQAVWLDPSFCRVKQILATSPPAQRVAIRNTIDPMPADEEEWTRVKTKSRNRQVPRKVPAKAAAAAAAPAAHQQAVFDQTSSTQTVADIEAEYETFRLRWQDTEASRRLKETVDSNIATGQVVRKAVCLGIGTFDPDHGGWDAKRRTYTQLLAFLDMVKHLSQSSDPIPCIFQEPVFSDSDKAFIESLGHKVVESPAAFEAVDEHTLLFAVHMYRPIYEAALEKGLPAAFVGTGWETWDDVGNLKEGDFACMRNMHESHRLLPFPQDGSHTTFSSTCLYWLPRAEDDDTAKDAVLKAKVEDEAKTTSETETIPEVRKDEGPAPESGKPTEASSSEKRPS
ncbi:hypothetical protein F5X68DRAFT_272311 [Plectosphaerella plurivora]|uniref:SRR1-like domain-containing protein n=1 Tax=Plectosphaerella plurivora TaxID=936078 RepID=A0A9P8VLA8_9PEZI|nr:hypothetical protein F5X68DRAFT_272311 [Plectosphaerella plurivora]